MPFILYFCSFKCFHTVLILGGKAVSQSEYRYMLLFAALCIPYKLHLHV